MTQLTAYRIVDFQLMDFLGRAISASGGVAYVTAANDLAKADLYTMDEAVASNPIALSNGRLRFKVLKAIQSLDIYLQCPGGQFLVLKDVVPGAFSEVPVDTQRLDWIYCIPFSMDDYTANTETDTGFDIPTRGIVLPTGVGVEVVTVDDTEDIDVGTLSSDSGDADGFIDGVSLATAGFVKATVTNGADTMGALLTVQDSANAGDLYPEANTSMSGKSITVTISAGADTAEGIIMLPVRLCGINALA